MTLTEHLNNSIQPKRVDESLVLSAIVCATCVAYAAGPVLNTDFMKSVGGGLGALLGGIGGMFGGIGFGGKDKIKELLKKDPDDLTGKEKDMLRKAANNPKLQKELSNNELKKLNKAIGKSSSDNDDSDLSDSELKEIRSVLKKKPGDRTKKEKELIQKYANNKSLRDELSDNELTSLDNALNETPKEETPKEETPNITESLLALATLANKNEEDPDKKAANESLIDIVTASCYDDDGNPVKPEDREKRMKDIVGEDGWEDFKKDLEEKQKSVSEDDFKEALEKANKDLTPEEAQKMIDDQKERAKTANAKIKKDKEELKKIDDEIAELQKKIDDSSEDSVMKDTANDDIEEIRKKVKELQDKRDETINKSTVGTASPAAAKAINKATAKKNGADPLDEPKKDDEPKKEETKQGKYIVKDEEVTDPETGKKIKVKTFTGPRGGKFYYPDGKPKKPENKVYVKEDTYCELTKYLLESINK